MRNMTTAKELAYKSYCDSLKVFGTIIDESIVAARFELWWSEWYTRAEHKEGFYHKHNVYIDGKAYIQAE